MRESGLRGNDSSQSMEGIEASWGTGKMQRNTLGDNLALHLQILNWIRWRERENVQLHSVKDSFLHNTRYEQLMMVAWWMQAAATEPDSLCEHRYSVLRSADLSSWKRKRRILQMLTCVFS